MREDRVTVSVKSMLETLSRRIDTVKRDIADALREIDNFAPSNEPALTYEGLRPLHERLAMAQTKLDAAKELASLLTTTSRNLSEPTGIDDYDEPRYAETAPSPPLDSSSQHRMSEMASLMRLSEREALQRCIATQYYVDTKLRDGWTFLTKRGRERRAVTFPGTR